ncbi:MAG: hypothetical protein R6U35_04115, partial [Candidatus Humimicrobiaceae bacterium]
MLEYEIKDDDYYLFSAGELSSREIYFIDGPKLKRMVNARNREELLKLLKETFYSKYLDELESGKSFEEILCREFADIATYLTKRLKKEHIQTINILFLAEKIHNLGVGERLRVQLGEVHPGEGCEPYLIALHGRTFTGGPNLHLLPETHHHLGEDPGVRLTVGPVSQRAPGGGPVGPPHGSGLEEA